MNSEFGNLFLSLQALIAALADNGGNKYFKYIDQDLGQLEYHDGNMRPPVLWPCVLIDIERMDFKSLGSNTQEGTGQVCFRIGFPPFSSTGAATPQQFKEMALNYYDLEKVLHQALQGTVPSYIVDDQDVLVNICGHLVRTNVETERRSDFIRVRKLTYSLAMDDYSTKQGVTLISPVAIALTTQFTE